MGLRRTPFNCKECGEPITHYEDFSFDKVGATERDKMKRWYHPECMPPEEDNIEILEAHLENEKLEVQRLLAENLKLRCEQDKLKRLIFLLHGDRELPIAYQDMANDIISEHYGWGDEE